MPKIALTKIAVYLMLGLVALGLTLFFFFQREPAPPLAKPKVEELSLIHIDVYKRQVLAMVILCATFITLGFGVVGGIGDVFSTMSEARRMGEWSLFMKTLGMVMAVVIVGVVLAVLVYTCLLYTSRCV